jgi:hypothetical protein
MSLVWRPAIGDQKALQALSRQLRDERHTKEFQTIAAPLANAAFQCPGLSCSLAR